MDAVEEWWMLLEKPQRSRFWKAMMRVLHKSMGMDANAKTKYLPVLSID